MNTVKSIRIATGTRKVDLENENLATMQIKDILKEHRATLIDRLLSDLTTYINYKFSTPANKAQLEEIRTKLLDLKTSSISLSSYGEVIGEVLSNDFIYVKSEPFYSEINNLIDNELMPSQLVLVK